VIPLDFIDRLFASDLLKSGGDIPEGHYADENMQKTVVPFRNAIMLSIACGLAESVGAEGSGDRRARRATTRSIRTAARNSCGRWATPCGSAPTPRCSCSVPFIALTKGQIAAEGARLGVDFAAPGRATRAGRHCGKCGTCVERREAFQLAGIADPTVYSATPPLPAKPDKGGEND
jgi:7-cyano-7-deazaguanine synthase